MKKFSSRAGLRAARLIVMAHLLAMFSGCAKTDSRIFSEWENSTLYKLDLLAERDNPESFFGYAYQRKSVKLSFRNDGTFSKEVHQAVEKFEFASEQKESLETGQDFSYETNGRFRTIRRQGKQFLRLLNESIKFPAGIYGSEEIEFNFSELDFDFPLESELEEIEIKFEDDKLCLWNPDVESFIAYEKPESD